MDTSELVEFTSTKARETRFDIVNNIPAHLGKDASLLVVDLYLRALSIQVLTASLVAAEEFNIYPDYDNLEALWGAYEYTADRDVLRAPMQMQDTELSFDQLSWQFVDISDDGGSLVLLWDQIQASISFKIAQ